VLWSALFLTSFGIVSVITSQQDRGIMAKFNNLVQFSKLTFDLYAIPNLLNFDVLTNGTGLLVGAPVGDTLDNFYQDMLSSEAFLHNLYEDTTNDTIKAMLNGNMCPYVQIDLPTQLCQSLLSGVLSQGLIKTSLYISAYYRRTKDLINSNRSFEMGRMILNDASNVEMELAGEGFLFTAFDMIHGDIKKDFVQHSDKTKSELLGFMIPIILFFVTVGGVTWVIINRNLNLASQTWRDLAKLVPQKAISNLKVLQHWLIRNRDAHK